MHKKTIPNKNIYLATDKAFLTDLGIKRKHTRHTLGPSSYFEGQNKKKCRFIPF